MLRFLLIALLLLFSGCGPDRSVGVMEVVLGSGEERELALTIWYPTDAKGSEDVVGNAVFADYRAVVDAPAVEGRHLLFVISHGGYRSARNSGSWLGFRLARSGFVAVEVNSPNLTDPALAIQEMQMRASDIRNVMDFMENDEAWSKQFDPNRVVLAGFALGGTVALKLVGLELDPDLMAKTCQVSLHDRHPDCDWLGPILSNLTPEDRSFLESNVAEQRVHSVVAINPEFQGAMVSQSLNIPELATIIQLGYTQTIDAEWGGTTVSFVPDAVSQDAFPICRPEAIQRLDESGENPAVCQSSQSRRLGIHQYIYKLVLKFVLPGTYVDKRHNQVSEQFH